LHCSPFGTHLEINGEVRELVIPGGLKVMARQLQGSPTKYVATAFGSVTAAAAESAPYCRFEVAEADTQVATRCITMSDIINIHKGAMIAVTLGRRAASQMYEK